MSVGVTLIKNAYDMGKSRCWEIKSVITVIRLACVIIPFPFPHINDHSKTRTQRNVYRIIEEREQHLEKTLAQLYDPDIMPKGLTEAHHQLDLAVEALSKQTV